MDPADSKVTEGGKKEHFMQRFTILFVFLGIAGASATALARDDKSPSEAAPIIEMLKAAKASDSKAFKNSYCERIRDDKGQGDWDRNMKQAIGNLKKAYGDYKLEEFTFKFVGDANDGK